MQGHSLRAPVQVLQAGDGTNSQGSFHSMDPRCRPHRYRTRRFPWLIERSAQFIRKYGITSVFLARFTAVLRAFVPLARGHTENVIRSHLCGQYSIGTTVGADTRAPWSVARPRHYAW
jgi:hypothetical protein